MHQASPSGIGAEELKALRILYDASRALAVCPDVEDVLRRVLDATLALLHAEKGFVEMMDRADGRLRVVEQQRVPGRRWSTGCACCGPGAG